ncbi:MED14-domain-containing protein [Punctularia strigosozonata HHB-11173 SS5]|uniref:MED14-domain-containing protein n=1 Tax=Punctularia strigosozonata (strain HHB-11173) TaxID=741275 RepID=UPI000441821E|nr:MED14-domain-containing protein [Punctularia strigosozonata HHB-11173 SS5]EIN12028.1 MED14-domain-containing protein [Punctularia strigosozonata HHB-11173 SS5]
MAVKLEDLGSKPLYQNGVHTNGALDDEPSVEQLEHELPVVYDGQIPLGELLSRVVQAIYAELSEMAETMPSSSDNERKRTLAEFVVRHKKQVAKLYALAKWARDADTVQKCMNITAFLMDQNRQFEDAVHGLTWAKESLDSARLRNHDILTSLDVLTTGSYQRLPTAIKKFIIPEPPLTDAQVAKTLSDIEDVIRYRLRMSEVIPPDMWKYRIADGRVFFTVPGRFESSLCLEGAMQDDRWFFVHAEFLFGIGGDVTGIQDFPREPTGIMKRHLTDEANSRLTFYSLPPVGYTPEGVELPPTPELPPGTVDAPLVRLFNFLQMMSMSYQLEILWFQAERIRALGWAEFLKVDMNHDRKGFKASYWIRKSPQVPPGRAARNKLPLLGGTLSIDIVETTATEGARWSPEVRVLNELAETSKLGGLHPSDQVENLQFRVMWEPMKGALAAVVSPEELAVSEEDLAIKSDHLDFEALLRKVIRKHTDGVLRFYQNQLQYGHTVYSPLGVVNFVEDDGIPALHVHMCVDEVVIITIDPRTGRLNMRDTGDLAAAGRGPRFTAITARLNENPEVLYDALSRLRLQTIVELAEQKANYLGLQSFRVRNFPKEEIAKLGPATRGVLYIQLAGSLNHYLVIVITDYEFRFALIQVMVMADTMYRNLVIVDIGWLDVKQTAEGEVQIDVVDSPELLNAQAQMPRTDPGPSTPRSRARFDLETSLLRELHAFCCARVAYFTVEKQFKTRLIPFRKVRVNPKQVPGPDFVHHAHSTLAHSVEALCVQASDILSGAPAVEAAMPNIRVVPINWWSGQKTQVVTCVKLKYVQQPVGKSAGTSTVIRLSKRIIYDTAQAVVSFLSNDVDKCVDEFVQEWARVSKMVVIAREVAQMSTKNMWDDVRLLSFDLQNVEFTYAGNYSLSITCTDQLAPQGGSYRIRFSRSIAGHDGQNPHEAVEPFMCQILQHGKLGPSLHRLVRLLRETLPMAILMEEIKQMAAEAHVVIDVFPKAAAWYRILYGDFRHALDFRLLRGQRVVVLDGSHSLFTHASEAKVPPDGKLGLRAIPSFKQNTLDTVKEVAADLSAPPVPLDIGILCETSVVGAIGRALHKRVLQIFKDAKSTG